MKHLLFAIGTAWLLLSGLFACNPSTKDMQQAIAIDSTVYTDKAPQTLPDTFLTFSNNKATLTMDMRGGGFTNFEIKARPVNPFSWVIPANWMPKVNLNKSNYLFKGHYLCTGRWGAPSEAEQAAGVPFNGETNTELWELEKPKTKNKRFTEATATCDLPLEQMTVNRQIAFSDTGSFFWVTETFKNQTAIGRITNFTQHATIAPPFLTNDVLIDCNAGLGFDQRAELTDLKRKAFKWPYGRMEDGRRINLRLTSDTTSDYVTSHIFDEGTTYGWITATNAKKGLLIGYLWKTNEYPWLNVWHHDDEATTVFGLEFSTTGFGKDYGMMIKENVRFFGEMPFVWLDAKQEVSKSYCCFMLTIPNDFSGVSKAVFNNGSLVLEEWKKPNRQLKIDVGNGWDQ